MQNINDKDFIKPFPGVIRIEPASTCNLKCSHCPTGTTKLKRGIMTRGTFLLILEQLKKHKNKIRVAVLYHGGEPFLNKEFVAMVKAIKQLGTPFIKTVSNGMLLTKSLAEEILQSGLDLIEFSIDGENPKQNDFVRRNCNFKNVVENIKFLIKLKEENKLKTPRIVVATTQFLPQKSDLKNTEQSPDVPGYLIKEFKNEYKKKQLDFKSFYAFRWPDMRVDRNIYDIYKEKNKNERLNSCDHISSTFTIRHNGDIVPCCFDLTSRIVMGNIHEDNIENIWNSEKYIEFRRSIFKREFNSLCDSCAIVKNKEYLMLKNKKHI